MSYYILPKINNLINVNPIDSSSNKISPYISQSLYYYYNNITSQIKDICNLDLSYNNYNELIKIVHPFEYVFSATGDIETAKYLLLFRLLKVGRLYEVF